MKTEKEKTTELQVIAVGETTFPVEVRNGRMAINLTAMGKLYGKQKQPYNWLRTDEAQRYLDALSKLQKCGLADLLEVRNGGTPGLNGTWCYDRRIAVRYAQFLDESLAIQVDTLLVDVLGKKVYCIYHAIRRNAIYIDGRLLRGAPSFVQCVLCLQGTLSIRIYLDRRNMENECTAMPLY